MKLKIDNKEIDVGFWSFFKFYFLSHLAMLVAGFIGLMILSLIINLFIFIF